DLRETVHAQAGRCADLFPGMPPASLSAPPARQGRMTIVSHHAPPLQATLAWLTPTAVWPASWQPMSSATRRWSERTSPAHWRAYAHCALTSSNVWRPAVQDHRRRLPYRLRQRCAGTALRYRHPGAVELGT